VRVWRADRARWRWLIRIRPATAGSQVSLASKMAGSVGAVEELLESLRAKALPAAEEELAEVTAFAKANGFSGEGHRLHAK